MFNAILSNTPLRQRYSFAPDSSSINVVHLLSQRLFDGSCHIVLIQADDPYPPRNAVSTKPLERNVVAYLTPFFTKCPFRENLIRIRGVPLSTAHKLPPVRGKELGVGMRAEGVNRKDSLIIPSFPVANTRSKQLTMGKHAQALSLEWRKNESPGVVHDMLETTPITPILAGPWMSNTTCLGVLHQLLETKRCVPDIDIRKCRTQNNASDPSFAVIYAKPDAASYTLATPCIMDQVQRLIEHTPSIFVGYKHEMDTRSN